MPQRCGRIASRSLGKQEQPRTQIRGGSLPTPQVSASSPWRPLAGSEMSGTRIANAFVRWNALECAGMIRNALELGTVWAQTTSAPIGSPYLPIPGATAESSGRALRGEHGDRIRDVDAAAFLPHGDAEPVVHEGRLQDLADHIDVARLRAAASEQGVQIHVEPVGR